MSVRAFFQPEAKSRVSAAIKEIELQTSAEIVVSVRRTSGKYRDVDYLTGFVIALGMLSFMLFSKQVFPIRWFPIDVAAAFVLGTLLSAALTPYKRLLVSKRRASERVHAAACEAFIKMGVSRTRGRTGILVFVSLFERRVAVVPDVGVDVAALGEEWTRAVAALDGSLGFSADFELFVAALRALGPVAKSAMPRADDDENELPDDVDAA
jgi:putative membrane protein